MSVCTNIFCKSDIRQIPDPNDDCNMGQSSNDSFPTAMHIASVVTILNRTIPGLKILLEALQTKRDEFDKIVKIGRHTVRMPRR